MDRLLVVDGSNLLFQMFYGMPEGIKGKNGKPIQGTLGFVGALLRMIRMVEPTHVAVVFDGECENERCRLDENYKANREDFSALEEEQIPFSQLPDIAAALNYLGICHRETEVCEADDWLAACAKEFGCSAEVVIASQDSDLFQLIGDNVKILRYRGEKSVMCDREYIRNKLGVTPEQYADFKSLTGDNSDNILGADKVGPKTAASLLAQFGTLEGVIDGVGQIAKPSIRESIIRNAARLRTNQRLIYLDGRHLFPFQWEQMRWEYSGQTTVQVLRGIGLR